MDCKDLRFSRHAFERMFQRGIDPNAVAQIVASGEVIAEYPDDQPFPSALLLGFHEGQPVHAVVAHDPATGGCHVVTIYRPDPVLWDQAFKKRSA
jgi:hypothetical protein